MGVHVDKAGCDDFARYVDLMRASGFADRPDLGDPVARDRDVGAKPRPPAAVDHLTAAQDVVRHLPPRSAGPDGSFAGNLVCIKQSSRPGHGVRPAVSRMRFLNENRTRCGYIFGRCRAGRPP